MKNVAASLLLAVSTALLPLPVLAEVDEPTAYRVMQETLLWDAVSAIPADYLQVVQSSVLASSVASLPASSQRVFRAANAALLAEHAQDSALIVMRKGLDADTVAEVRRWNATPLGQKLLATEKASAAGIYLMYRGFGGVTLPEMDVARRQALADIIGAKQIPDAILHVALGQSLVAVRSMAASDPARRDLPSEEELGKRDLTAARQQLPIMLMPNFAALYEAFPTEELQQYVSYLRSPAARKLAGLNVAAVAAVVKDANEAFRRNLLPH